MNIPILKFKIINGYTLTKTKFFHRTKKIEESYIISLEYDIDEDRFYYIDNKKCIPTKKDLSRSILMIYEIYERYKKFGLADNFKLYENKLDVFLNNFFNCNLEEDDAYLNRMIFGTQPIKLLILNSIINELGIDNVDFTKYYYIQYPTINFR